MYAIVDNKPLNLFDYLGLRINDVEVISVPRSLWDSLDPCQCGPDTTAFIQNEVSRLYKYVNAAPLPPQTDSYLVDLVNVGKFLLWYAKVMVSLNYAYQAAERENSLGQGWGCPSAKCSGTVSFCGRCVGSDVPGNIMFGFAAAALMPNIIRNNGAVVAEFIDMDEEWIEPSEDIETFQLGRAMIENGVLDICYFIQALPSKKENKNCKLCGDSCGFTPADLEGIDYPDYSVAEPDFPLPNFPVPILPGIINQ